MINHGLVVVGRPKVRRTSERVTRVPSQPARPVSCTRGSAGDASSTALVGVAEACLADEALAGLWSAALLAMP